jgi:hypothetical protein
MSENPDEKNVVNFGGRLLGGALAALILTKIGDRKFPIVFPWRRRRREEDD